ncbi:MAG: hypothetical protein ACYYK0_01175 [Candidatus Eutrophobiaceae bacterium]
MEGSLMALYRINKNSLDEIEKTTFSKRGIKERTDLQPLLKSHIEVIADDVMIIGEEFGAWEGSNRRVDLLGIDRNANIVAIELKRTEDGGHMELQAIRYAAMLSTMTFEQAVKTCSSYMQANNIDGDPEESILGFLDWEEADEDRFAQDVRIILASAEFSKELTTSVIWLNDRNLDIKCIRMRPYIDGENTLLDVQQVIPLPEAAEYQIKVREKQQKVRQSRTGSRDFTRFNLSVNGNERPKLAKRWLIFHLISDAIHSGIDLTEIQSLLSWKGNLFISFNGELDAEEFERALMKTDPGGRIPRTKRFFCDEGELFQQGGKTYALNNQWGRKTMRVVDAIKERYPQLAIDISPVA